MTIVSVGHRPELEAFDKRKITLERRRGGAEFVTDIRLRRSRLIKNCGGGDAPRKLFNAGRDLRQFERHCRRF